MGLRKWLRSWLGVDAAVAEGRMRRLLALETAVKEMREHQHCQDSIEEKYDHSECCG